MNTRNKKEGGALSLVEAIETLSNIADLEFDREVGISKTHDLVVQDKQLIYHTVHWLHHKDANVTINMVKDTFRVVLNYLRDFYSKEYRSVRNEQAIEGIKTIMVLVGEAAKKLDKYTTVFNRAQNKSVTELEEYKKLQEFYLSRIARQIDEGTIGKWILAITNKVHADQKVKLVGRKSSQTKHVFIDLESVKKDTEYELFFMRKEDGTRFFSPRLIRNIKLVSDFGNYFGEVKDEDPLLHISKWQDQVAHDCARNIVSAVRVHIDRFYRETRHYKDHEFVESINKALMALMLCANPQNLSHNLPIKSCRNYFYDFQLFLRGSLHTSEYHKLIAYPPGKSSRLAHCLLDTVHSMCIALYTQMAGLQSLKSVITGVVQQAEKMRSKEHHAVAEKSRDLWNSLAGGYAAMSALLKLHPNGAINKILDTLQDGAWREFDPLLQENVPSNLYTLYLQESKVGIARWPSPTVQEFIHKASVIDEFKGFLRACAHARNFNKCLVINFQDRTSWKEYARCAVIEDLSNHESFTRHIDIVTLAKDTEFYHQLTPYFQESHADVFIQQFKEHLSDESCGFLFPEFMRKVIFGGFVDGVMEGIHRVFFSNKNVIPRERRLDFIEIFYFFLELKLIELSKSDIVGFLCKDGVDISEGAAVQMFVFLKLLNQEWLSENDREELDLMLYGPSLLCRERLMHPERFNRMLSALRSIESLRNQFGHKNFVKVIREAFGTFFKTPILEAKTIVQKSKDIL